MNLKGIGLWSARKEHFSIFTCVFARECQSRLWEKAGIRFMCKSGQYTRSNAATARLLTSVKPAET